MEMTIDLAAEESSLVDASSLRRQVNLTDTTLPLKEVNQLTNKSERTEGYERCKYASLSAHSS